ncbi:MAG: peptide ABC transporter substrate-binding protein [Thermomicrobiales bacterium]
MSADDRDLTGQLEIMKRRLEAGGMSRRQVLKVAASAAGTAMAGAAAIAPRGAEAVGGARARRMNALAQTTGEEQVFYNPNINDNPSSFDWNLNLYCNAEVETFAGLLTFNENLEAVGDWAETFTANEDASVWTFSIRPNNTGWSDGTPVTANDFVWSFRRQLDPANGAAYAGFLFDIKYAEQLNTQTPVDDAADPLNGTIPTVEDIGVVALDDWTLEVTCAGPRAYFPQVVAYIAAYPSPQWMVEEYGDRWALGQDIPIVSNGPFKVDNWEYDVKIELSKNEGYWDAERIRLATVVDPIYPAAQNVLLYEEGSGDQRLDWTTLSAADYSRFQEDAELSQQIQPYVYPGIWMLLPQVTVEPFNDLQVRQALSHAIDRSRLETLTNGLVTPAWCMVPAGVFGFLDDPSLQEVQNFDPALAMEMLQGTPYEGGEGWPEVTMYMRADEEIYNADIMANDLVAQLQENIGLEISIQTVPQSNFSEQLFENTWPLVFIRWWYDYPDPNNGYGDMFYSRKASGKRQAWSNDEFDDLVNAGRAEPDTAKRLDVYLQAETVIQQDVGYMPLVYRQDQNVFKPWVRGVPVNNNGYAVPNGNIFVRMLTKAYVEGRPAE